MKGFRLGTAHVSEKHANFIQADKGGRADDVRALMEHVRRVVAERCGVTLRTEVRLLGFDGGETGAVPEADEQLKRERRHRPRPGRDRTAAVTPEESSVQVKTPTRREVRRAGRAGRGGRAGGGRDGRSRGKGAGSRGGSSGATAAVAVAAAEAAGPMDPRISARRTAVIREQGRRRLRVVVIGLAGTACPRRRLVLAPLAAVLGPVDDGGGQRARDGGAGVAQAGPGRPPAAARRGRRRGGRAHRAAALGAHGRRARSWPDGVHITVTEETPRFVGHRARRHAGPR